MTHDPLPPQVAAAPPARRFRRGFRWQVAQLTGANALVVLLGLLTGPIQARALGPSGRGSLAAIIVPLSMGPVLLDFGLQIFVTKSRAQGTAAGRLLGTFTPISFLFGCIGIAAALPLSHVLGRGRGDVETLLVVGLCLNPLGVVLQTVQGVIWGEERFSFMGKIRLGSALLPAISLVTLSVMGELTVTGAALSFILGGLLASGPLLGTLWRARPRIYDRVLARTGLSFGARTWLGTLSGVANGRLDQLLMAALVSRSQLGLYAVAVTASSFAAGFVGAVGTVLAPRAARSESELVGKSSRVSIAMIGVISVALSVASPVLIPLMFGSSFQPAVAMVVILAIGNPAGAVVAVLTGALTSADRPGVPSRAQFLGIAVSAPLLAVLLPGTGGLGAAVISTCSTYLMAAYLTAVARRQFVLRTRDIWMIRLQDVAELVGRVRADPAVA